MYRLLHVGKKNFREHFALQLNDVFRGELGPTGVVVDRAVTDPRIVRGFDSYDSTEKPEVGAIDALKVLISEGKSI